MSGGLPSPVKAKTNLGTAPVGAGNVVTGTNPASMETLAAKVAQYKAEDKAKGLEEQVATWQIRFNDASESQIKASGQIEELKVQLSQANARMENALRDMNNAVSERDSYKRLRDEASGSRDEANTNFEKLKTNFNVLNEKYQNALKTNLDLSNKLTTANVDYLDKAREVEKLNEALSRSRNEAKKILKINV
jgi:chromosome segregation ATPase